MALGSYIRFGAGILLSMEAIRLWIFKEPISFFLLLLSAVYIVLAAAWFIFRF